MGEPTGPAPSRRRAWPSVALPAAVGLLVALAYLPGAGRALDFDSSQTVGSYVRTPSLLDPFRSQRLFNNHPVFSFVEHVVHTVSGSSEEWVLRLAPIGFAAGTIAVVVGVLRRHLGLLPAACGGLFLATNPTVIELSRAVRGYSLLLLCGVVSTVALAELVGSPEDAASSRRWSACYIAAVAVGTGTHLYMVPIVLGHVAVVGARRRLDDSWGFRWLAGLGLGASAYAAMLPDLLDAARAGPRTFKPEFPVRLGEVVVGSDVAAVLLAVVVAVGATILLRHRNDLRLAAFVVGAAVAGTWLVTASVHLEARFHVWLVPAAAALVAAAVNRVPWLAVLVVAGAALNIGSVADGYVDDPNAQPELAALLEHAARRGDQGCVTSYSILPILGYTSSFQPVIGPADLRTCDVVAIPFPVLDHVLADAAREQMSVAEVYDAWFEDGLALARDPAYFERLCREGEAALCPP